MKQTATFTGTLVAYASSNPFQTVLELVLTDFLPNKNGQMIPATEADNLITSAKNMPLKINFKNGKESGHNGAYPIGTLSDVWLDDNKIMARSIVWNNEYPDVDYYLKEKTEKQEPIYTSWEIFYSQATEEQGYQQLHDTVFAGTCIVENPAYGTRTPILSVAERQHMDEQLQELEKDREVLYALLNLLGDIEMSIYQKQQDIALDTTNVAERLTHMLQMLQERETQYAALQTQVAELTPIAAKVEVLENELATYKAKEQEAEVARKEQELVDQRFDALANVGLKYTSDVQKEKRGFILAMSEQVFKEYVKEVKSFASVKQLPEPLHSGNENVTNEDFKDYFKKNRG